MSHTKNYTVLLGMLLFFFIAGGLQSLMGEHVYPGRVNQVLSGIPTPVDAALMKQYNWFREGYLYTAFRVELTRGSSYTFEFQYPAIKNDFGFSFLTGNPYNPTIPTGEPLFCLSKSMQNSSEPGKPNRITKTLFTVNPASKGNVLYILVPVWVGTNPDPGKAVSLIIKNPPDGGVDQAQIMPGWEERGKLFFYDNSGEIKLIE